MPDRMTPSPDVATQVLNLIEFLSAYDAQRNPAVRDIAELNLYRLAGESLPIHPAVRVTLREDAWLEVDFLDLPPRPPVPPGLAELLQDGDRLSADRAPDVMSMPAPAVEDDRPTREAEWSATIAPVMKWIDSVWAPWAQLYRDVRAVKKLHRELFEQRDRLITDRESVELVWGFGRLRWSVNGTKVDHPLLTVPVEVEIVPGTEQIRIKAAGAPEVESRFLYGLDLHDGNGYNAIKQSVSFDGLDPWDGAQLAGLSQRLIRAVDDEGIVVVGTAGTGLRAAVDTGWTLYLRRRVPDSQEFLAAMRELYRENPARIPAPLRAVMTTGLTSSESAGTSEQMLLPLATNAEQQRIVEMVQRNPGVTVQGPPGTGKSHTIANLISHYVAYGRRVLVVAEKEQALGVLAEKIPPGIRDLTVSVLGADEVGRQRLEGSITSIQTRVNAVDRPQTDRRIAQLTERLAELDRELAAIDEQMLTARRAETQTLPGQTLTPARAAEWLVDHQHLGYIADALGLDDQPPLEPAELAELKDLAESIGPEKADQAGYLLPDPGQLPSATGLGERFTRLRELDDTVHAAGDVIADLQQVRDAGEETLQGLVTDLIWERDWRQAATRTWVGLVVEQLQDALLRGEWVGFREGLETARRQAMSIRSAVRAHQVVVPQPPTPNFAAQLAEAREKLKDSGKLGLFARDAKRAVELCRVDGHPPTTADEVELCLQALQLEDLRRQLAVGWANQACPLGAPPLAGLPEEAVVEAARHLDEAIAAPQRWSDLGGRLQALGLRRPAAMTPDALQRTIFGSTSAAAVFAADRLRVELTDIAEMLTEGSAVPDASTLWDQLADALTARDVTGWHTHLSTVKDLAGIAPAALRLRVLRDRLAARAPLWTRAILKNPSVAGKAIDLPAAWEWRQWDGWVRTVTDLPGPSELQVTADDLHAQLQRATTELVTQRAWRRLADNLGPVEKQALAAYLKAVNRYGKTGGKFAQRWINEMRTALDESKTAVPVWIMPTARALSSFRPSAEPPFDVIIIDEASQINFTSLPLLSLAPSAIIVGDDKQTSPENVGLDRTQIFDLMDDYLSSVPRYRTLFDPDNSLYDLATQKFSDTVMLTEHFRCLPEIIGFSNTLAYDGRIIPLRDQAPHPGWTPLGWVRVRDGRRTGDVNEAEAAQVVSLIAELCADRAYDGMTFGVISLLGTAQSKLIYQALYEELGPEQMQSRRVRCGEAANFQGDERDVMVLCTVVSLDPSGSGRIGAMTSGRDVRRMNVAASRAKNQMWVVTSVDPEELPAGDMRAALISHCSEPGSPPVADENRRALCESELERRVLDAILDQGYLNVEVQRPVGQYHLDIVVSGPDGRLAIECDSDRWEGEEVWRLERARQQVLERAGWSFERIRGSAFFRDPVAAMEPVWDRLALLGIVPGVDAGSGGQRAVVREVSGLPFAATTLDPAAAAFPPGDTAEAPAVEQPWTPPAWYRAPAVETPMAATPSVDADPSPAATVERMLAPYQEWVPRAVPAVDLAHRDEVCRGLLEIVGAEGPVRAGRVFRLYGQAAGASRVGTEMHRVLAQITERATRTGQLSRLQDPITDLDEATLFLPETDAVVLRERGPRDLYDIPRSEIRTLMDSLGIDPEPAEAGYRQLLAELGLGKLTAKARAYLDHCRRYTWKV